MVDHHEKNTSPGRQRAPTITIDGTNDSVDADNGPARASSDPTTITSPDGDHSLEPPSDPSQTNTAARGPSLDSRDSRPTSPHNVALGPDRIQNFLAVPDSKARSRQNSVDSDDGSHSFVSGEDTAVATAPYTGEKGGRLEPNSVNAKIINDKTALNPDQGKDDDFRVDNNPFAFSPGQLTKMFNPKSLGAFYMLGGLKGLEKGLRSDRKAGLSAEEVGLDGAVSFEQATQTPPQPLSEKLAREGGPAPPARAPTGTHGAKDGAVSTYVDRRRVYRDNRIPEKKGKSLLQLMWITYNDKVLILLSVAAVVSLAIGLYQTFGQSDGQGVEWVEGVAIIVAIVIVVVVGSLNDYQKERQFAKLNKKKQSRDVKVIRSGKTLEVSVFDVVVGDVLHLEPGDMVPVDGVLIEGFNVKCDESQATGESDVIKKRGGDEVFAAIENGEKLSKQDPFIQSGSRVMEGVGTYLVTGVGVYSSYGQTLMSLDDDPEITPLQSKLNTVAEYIAKLGGAAGLLLFIVLFIKFLALLPKQPASVTPAEKGQNFLEIFIVVVTIIVVAVPEGLPLAVTLALAFATTRMLKDNNLVRHLKACEVMGNATTICSDKTGTLTQNKMQVVAGTVGTTHRFGSVPTGDDGSGAPTASPDFQDVAIGEFVSMLGKDVKELLLKSIALNSTAFEGEVDGEKSFVGSKTETAMLFFAREHLAMGSVSEERASAKILQLIPFDSGRKCMGIVVQLPNGRARLYVKGASEIVLRKCTQILRDPSHDTSIATLSDDNRATIEGLIRAYASSSLRTIGIVYRDFEAWPPRGARKVDGDRDEVNFSDFFRSMVFAGMVGIKDPLRPGVPEAVATCQKAGVVVRMVTGDNKLTAEAIAKDCGIIQPNSLVMEGPEFRNLPRPQQREVITRLHVLARSSPEDKRILVKLLKERHEVVAVTGDGTNDAPALKGADVGFSMGIAGTEVAKEASAIILMDDNFNSIVKALKWGRAVNDAVKRFLQFQLTVNVTAVVLTFVSAVSNDDEESVLTAVQLLWVNLIMDTLAALALATDPPSESVLHRKPEPRTASIISPTMWKMIIGQSIYQLVITFLLYFGCPAVLPDYVDGDLVKESDYIDGVNMTSSQIQTLVFNTFVWMQIFNQWNNRRLDNGFNIFEGIFRNWFFIIINLIMCGGQAIIVIFGGAAFHISPHGQTPSMWGAAILLGVISIPFGMIIRLIPDELLAKLVPEYIKRMNRKSPELSAEEEEKFEYYPVPLADVRHELAFIKTMKGGRLNNLKFAMKHPRQHFQGTGPMSSRTPSGSREPSRDFGEFSRANSVRNQPPTPVREDSYGSQTGGVTPTPDSRRRSRSTRSRSNSALGAPTVMAGIIASSIAAGWSPAAEKTEGGGEAAPVLGETHMTSEPQEMGEQEGAGAGESKKGGDDATDSKPDQTQTKPEKEHEQQQQQQQQQQEKGEQDDTHPTSTA